MKPGRRSTALLLLLGVLLLGRQSLSSAVQSSAKDDATTTTTTTTTTKDETESSSTTTYTTEPPPAKKGRDETVLTSPHQRRSVKFDPTSDDWGTYYDPQNIFCGPYDCYKILGFDYESFGRQPPTAKEITKRYRALSREWHPDKSKHGQAKERFVKIARAYEILNDEKQKKEYDDLRYDQEAYFRKYGTSVLWKYAPKSDLWLVLLVLLILFNGFSYFLQYNKWQRVADRFIQAVVYDWSVKEGGSAESKALREQALEILLLQQQQQQQQQQQSKEPTDDTVATKTTHGKKLPPPPATTTTTTTTTTTSSKKVKLTAKEKKRQEQEQLYPIVKEIVYRTMTDFGAGFHQPTWQDMWLVQMVYPWPIRFLSAVVWQMKYYIRRVSNLPLSEEEQSVLTQRAVGMIYWNTANELQRQQYIQKELWKYDHYKIWKEELEFQKLSSTEQKIYLKEKKQQQQRNKKVD